MFIHLFFHISVIQQIVTDNFPCDGLWTYKHEQSRYDFCPHEFSGWWKVTGFVIK